MRIRRLVYPLSIAAATLASAAFVISNRFKFFVNPDSYYYLLVARNLAAGGNPSGSLGAAGMPFPPQGYAAMKVVFPALVALLTRLGVGAESAGHAISGAAAVASVPLSALAARRLFRSQSAAVLSAVLVATSWSLIYWSGFVLSDSLSVALALAFIALVAAEREDVLVGAGDILVGVIGAALLLSRPAYVVTVPVTVWLGFVRFGWTWRRAATAAASMTFTVSALAVWWFPPATLGLTIARRLWPVGLVATIVGVVLLYAFAPKETDTQAANDKRAVLVGLLTLVLPLTAIFAMVLQAQGYGPDPFGLVNFTLRDAGLLLLAPLGAWHLAKSGQQPEAAALAVSTFVMLGLYTWADARESRYLVHLLPTLVLLASGAVVRGQHPRPLDDRPRHSLTIAIAVVIAVSLLLQVLRVAEGPRGDFLLSDYPSYIAPRIKPHMRAGEILVSAVPWAYHFRTGAPSWAADARTVATFTRYVPADSTVLVLDDAALRQHRPHFAAALASSEATRVARFAVPGRYQYGFVQSVADEPVLLYRLHASELQRLARDAVAEESSKYLPTP